MSNLIGWHSLKTTFVTEDDRVDVVFYGGGTTVSDAVLPSANNLNLTLHDLTGTNYRALAVVVDGSPGAASQMTLKLRRVRVRVSGDGYALFVRDTSGSTTPTKALVLEGGAHLAVNADNDLVLVNSGLSVGSAEENGWVHFGDLGLRAVRISGKWYLVVCQ